MKPWQKIFQLEEANRLLPTLEVLLNDLEEKQEVFRRLQDRLFFEELVEASAPPDEKLQVLEETLVKLEEELGKIHKFGCLLRHPEKGLVDFRALRNGEPIYYCWRRGEKQVEYFHSLRGGFFERQRL